MIETAVLLGWVAAGSACGGLLRMLVSGAVARALRETFPWGTLTVNVTGAFATGVLFALARGEAWLAEPEAWAIAVTGFVGSYTTVSSFSLQTLVLLQVRQWRRAAANVLVSVVACLLACAAGLSVAARMAAGAPI